MNITKRRMFPALLTILLFATLLAGCAGKQSDAGQNDASQKERSRQDLLLWISRVKARNVYM